MKYMFKECTICGISKPETEYYLFQKKYRLNFCNACKISKDKRRRDNMTDEEKQKYQEYHINYRSANRERIQKRKSEAIQNSLELRFKHICRNSKQRALLKNWEYELDWEFLLSVWNSQKGICALSGDTLELSGGMLSNKLSLDRIDSTKGYLRGNVQFITIRVNYMKRDIPQDEFIELCRKIAR